MYDGLTEGGGVAWGWWWQGKEEGRAALSGGFARFQTQHTGALTAWLKSNKITL